MSGIVGISPVALTGRAAPLRSFVQWVVQWTLRRIKQAVRYSSRVAREVKADGGLPLPLALPAALVITGATLWIVVSVAGAVRPL